MVEILKDVYSLEKSGFVNIFVIGTREAFSLIDTGIAETAAGVIDELENEGFKLKNLFSIILTHRHPDHIGGLKEILELSTPVLYAHKSDAAAIQSELAKKQCRKIVIDSELEHGDSVDLLGGLEVINLPGHTPGSIALYQRDKKIMFIGDVIKEVDGRGLCIGAPEHYNFDTEQTIRDGLSLLEYDIETALLSHGTPIMKHDIQKLYNLKSR